MTRVSQRLHRLIVGSALATLSACGGGSSDGPVTPAVTPVGFVTVSPTTGSLEVGGSLQLSAAVLDAGGLPINRQVPVTWASSDASRASVSQTGLVTAVAPGTGIQITATAEGKVGTSTIAVVDNTPARIALSQTGGITLQSGTTATLTATVTTQSGRVLTGLAIAWGSSRATVARVDNGVVTGSLVGTANVTASVGTVVSDPLVVSVTPGTPARLSLRRQPSGVSVAAVFLVQPEIEILDAAGNLTAGATPLVSASIEAGGGSLSGTLTASAVNSVATFTDLVMTGTTGPRTLRFTSSGLSSVASNAFTLAPGTPATAVIASEPVGGAIGAALLAQPVVELRDVSGNVSTSSTAPVTASLASGSGSLAGATVNAIAGVATFSALTISGQPGAFTLAFSTAGVTTVSAQPVRLAAVVYGSDSAKVAVLDVGQAFTPLISSGSPPTFRSSASSRVSVDGAGRATARADGQSWISATNTIGADSLLVIVPRNASGPVLRADLSSFVMRAGAAVRIPIVLDPRGSGVGSASFFITINTQDYSPTFTLTPGTLAGGHIVANRLEGGVFRVSFATTGQVTTPITLGHLDLSGGAVGAAVTLSLNFLDASTVDGSNLLLGATSTYFPLIFR